MKPSVTSLFVDVIRVYFSDVMRLAHNLKSITLFTAIESTMMFRRSFFISGSADARTNARNGWIFLDQDGVNCFVVQGKKSMFVSPLGLVVLP